MNLNKIPVQLEQGEPVTIVAVGDSLTKGWMVTRGYVDCLNQMILKKYPRANIVIKKRGMEGDTAGDGLARIDRDAITHQPDLVLLQFGLNELFMGLSPLSLEKNLTAMIEKVQTGTSSEILLLTSSLIIDAFESKRAQSYYDRIIEIGEKFNTPVVRVHEYWKSKIESGIDHGALVQFDGVHPTEYGHHLMAEAVVAAL